MTTSGGLDFLPVEVRRMMGWFDPLSVAAGLAMQEGALCLLSDPALPGSRSYVAARPDSLQVIEKVEGPLFEALRGDGLDRGVVGLAAYDAGARPATGDRPLVWPDLILARYPAMITFHHDTGQVEIIGRGMDQANAEEALRRAGQWIEGAVAPGSPPPPARSVTPEASPDDYRQAVASVVERMASGELFQANVARGWQGKLNAGSDPFDVLIRLAARGGAAFGAFWRIGDLCLVSNSPELFLTLRLDADEPGGGRVETRPIKGTRPRGPDGAADALQASELSASTKDRAENLMIVDLMRNDLSRVCLPGTVKVTGLFEVERLPTVHHLVSTVTGQLQPGLGPADLLDATFPPGSITGAPKHQAMKVIASLEPPRGAWCGSLFLLDQSGGLTASVLIRSVAFRRVDGRWSWRAQAGAGIVADSMPQAELEETRVKFKALSCALYGQEPDAL